MTITDYRAPQDAAAGRLAAEAGAGFAALGAHLDGHGASDAVLLGLSHLPPPSSYVVAVDGGSEDERRARIDAFAAAHGVTAGWHAGSATYRAVVRFGPVSYVAFTRAEGDLRAWTEAARERMNEILADLAERRPAA